MLKPYLLFKGKHLWDSWLSDGHKDFVYNVSESGWMESSTFVDWFTNVFIVHCSRIEGPKILIMDNHSSHISIDIVNLARENQIHILALPAHSSHLLQPLDVGVFKHVKVVWREIVEAYFKSSGFKNVEKSVFSSLFAKLKDSGKAFNRSHVVAGFEQTGIFPLNRHAVNPIRLKASFSFSRSESSVSSSSNGVRSSSPPSIQENGVRSSSPPSIQENGVRSSSPPSSHKRSHGYELNQCPKKRRLNGKANTIEHDLIELNETNEQMEWQDSSYDSDTCSTTSSIDSLMSELMHEQCPDKQIKAVPKRSKYSD
jgi:hypothetical protein